MSKKSPAFTMIELLVVISIIAILTTIGISMYTGVQARARDAKRQVEVDSISKALEINKTNAGYQPLQDVWFQVGSIPTTGPKGDPYCIAAPSAGNPAPWTTSCPGLSGYAAVSASTPAANSASFKVCASLESPTPNVYCKASVQ